MILGKDVVVDLRSTLAEVDPGGESYRREAEWQITVASEVMAVLALASDLQPFGRGWVG